MEKRSNKYRVKHYIEINGNKRKYSTCKLADIEAQDTGVNGNHITYEALQRFAMFCKVDLLGARKTIKELINILKRYRKVIQQFAIFCFI